MVVATRAFMIGVDNAVRSDSPQPHNPLSSKLHDGMQEGGGGFTQPKPRGGQHIHTSNRNVNMLSTLHGWPMGMYRSACTRPRHAVSVLEVTLGAVMGLPGPAQVQVTHAQQAPFGPKVNPSYQHGHIWKHRPQTQPQSANTAAVTSFESRTTHP